MSSIEATELLEGIAIIGMAGRFPGADNIQSLWKNLCDSKESITFFRDDELDPSINTELIKSKKYVKAKGLISEADKFDANFFKINPREAAVMDPQQRLFLETAWHALEDAGYDPDKYEGLIGVYGGTGYNSYFTHNILSNPSILNDYGEHQASIGNGPDYLCTRLSYKLNLRGPSISIYTGCSLSLVAVCMGFDSLMSYQSDMVLAGGTFIRSPINSGYSYQEGGMESADGHCRPFDAEANGTVFSDGVGIVVLKRLNDAIENNDNIYAVIRGAAVNNDGSKKVSFTAPSVDAQAEVIAMTHASANINPETISYIECHGTGTPMGDPIEIEALTQAFRYQTQKKNFCAIGSVKSNIGHLDAAAGVAGLIKTALMLHNKTIPPTINFSSPNPKINFDESPFYVNSELKSWDEKHKPLRAGVSSLGVGGTNAHVVLEEAPKTEPSAPPDSLNLIVLSAKTHRALGRTDNQLLNYIKQNHEAKISDIAYTLQVGRKHFEHRQMFICHDYEDAIELLESKNPKRIFTREINNTNSDVIFMFSGQGAQYPNMGFGIYNTNTIFRNVVDQCSEILQPHLNTDLREIIYPKDNNIEEASNRLKQTVYTQPVLFVIEYALSKLWIDLGIKPFAMIGHSIGEYVAACLGGVFSLEDTLSIVATRGQLMQSLPSGSMLAVSASEEKIKPFLDEDLSIAVINGPSLCVISGENRAVDEFEKRLDKEKFDYQRLRTSHAFHSKMMEPILDKFSDYLKKFRLETTSIPFISNITGTWITPEETCNPEYWAKHLRQTVRFSQGLTELMREPNRVLLEVGPGHTLTVFAKQHPNKTSEHGVCSTTRKPKETSNDEEFLLQTIGHLWLNGVDTNWIKLHEGRKRHKLSLPGYPFERKRLWIEAGQKNQDIQDLGNFSYGDINEEIQTEHSEDAEIDQLNNSEKKLMKLWQNLLGVDHLSKHDDFFDLGGSSFTALRLFAQIEEIFETKLPVSTLYQAPTIEELADLIGADEADSEWNNLIQIKQGSSSPPLFLVHGAGGNVLFYRELAQNLGIDIPVYGLQSRGLDGKEKIITTIEEMASAYIEEIKRVQETGPYYIGGYCMGGSVAFEIGQQLKKRGDEVDLIILLETYNFSNIPEQTFFRKAFHNFQKADFHFRNFLLLSTKSKWTFFLEKLKEVYRRRKVWYGMIVSKFGMGQDDLSSTLAKIWKINDDASLNYIPKPYNGSVLQFIPIKEYAHHLGPGLDWDGLVNGNLETIQLPVYPAGMLIDPFVKMLADKIKSHIKISETTS